MLRVTALGSGFWFAGSLILLGCGSAGGGESGVGGTPSTPRGGSATGGTRGDALGNPHDGGAGSGEGAIDAGGTSAQVAGGGGGGRAGGPPSSGNGGQAGSSGDPPHQCETAADCQRKLGTKPCEGAWQCQEGDCVLDEGEAVDCSGVEPLDDCHDVVCDAATGDCRQKPSPNARPCGGDFCSAGQCTPNTGVCAPSVVCAGCATCSTEAEACVTNADACLIDGACRALGTLKAANGCLACAATARDDWSPLPVDTTCHLDDTCFTTFACSSAGACEGRNPAIPTAPRPIRPVTGSRAGSVWAPAERDTRRPKFVWSDVNNACASVTYDFQLDASCSSPETCTFDAPEVDEQGLTTPSYQPAADLGVSVTAPVGRRYYWRVRACRGPSCSGWSSTRYVDVGRAPHDYNGDGYSDLAISAQYASKLAVAYGSASGPSTPIQVAKDRPVTYGSTGDVNGDGFDDLLIYGRQPNSNPSTWYFGYFGSASGLPATPEWKAVRLAEQRALAGADYNNDGFDDLVLQPNNQTSADYFWGSASGPPTVRSGYVTSIASPADAVEWMTTGDVNGDALPDLVAEAGWFQKVHVWRGGERGFAVAANDVIPTLAAISDTRINLAVGDVNGDYADDVLQAAESSLSYKYGALYVYPSHAGSFDDVATGIYPDNTHGMTDNYGHALVGGQLIGQDGRWDFAISAPRSFANGTIYVYEGSKIASLQPIELDNPSGHDGWGFGYPLQVPGDVNGDGNDDLVVCDRDQAAALIYFGPITKTSKLGTQVVAPADFPTFCDILL